MKIVEIQNPPSVEALVDRFGRQRYCFVLDSAQSNDGLGEWSFFGAEPFETVTGDLADLRQAMRPYQLEVHPEIPFTGGAVGYLSYDYGRRLENLDSLAKDDRQIPDMHFGLYDGVAALNHETGVLFLVGHHFSDTADAVIERLRAIVGVGLDAPTDTLEQAATVMAYHANVISDLPARRSEWKWHLSQRARCTYEGDSLALYQPLRLGNPAPYGAYLDLGDWQLISTSPEQFLHKSGRQLETRPIKGTRPRGIDAEANRQNEAALRVSQKDRAELLMIVDLERNDLGRVAEFGSVQVEGLYQLEHYAKVIHQTARVKATLAEHKDIYDALAAIFPGGSITGAPKIRAMQIIEELEPTRRGAYCGSIGYIGFDGDSEFNIAIRSLHLKDGQLDYQVGGGIVWDSDPEDEYQETLDKARAIRETIDQLCQTSS